MKLSKYPFPGLRGFFISAVLFGLAGCHPEVLIVPSYIQTVGVALVQNETSYFGLDTMLTQATIRAFQVDGRLAVEDPERSDLLVKIVIRKYIEEPIFYDLKTNNVLQYRISIDYDLASVDQREKKTFSEDKDRVQSVLYYTPSYTAGIVETKDQALARLADDMSRSIVRRVLTGY